MSYPSNHPLAIHKVSNHLEVLLEREVSVHHRCGCSCAVGRDLVLLERLHDTGLLVVTNTLLEEVGLATERDVLHEVEGVGGVVELAVAEGEEQTVGDELDVLAHEGGVHAEERAGKGVRKELLLDLDGLGDDALDEGRRGLVLELGEEQASKVGVHTLVTGDELVGEGQTGHETALLQPEDGGE